MVPMAVSFQSPRAFPLRGPYCAHQAIFQTAAMTPGTELHDIRMEMGLSPRELWEVMSAEMWRSHAEGLPSYWDRIYDGIVDMSNGRPCSLIPETRIMFRDRRRHGRARPNHHRIEDERIQRRPRVEGPHECDVCIDNRQHHPSGHHQGRNPLLGHVEPFDADHSMDIRVLDMQAQYLLIVVQASPFLELGKTHGVGMKDADGDSDTQDLKMRVSGRRTESKFHPSIPRHEQQNGPFCNFQCESEGLGQVV
ncbi:MAG: hypothetical protein Q9202_000433 [Teloschistes flavicans]